MFTKHKVISYIFLISLVLVLPNLSHSIEDAKSCRGWDCSVEGQICPMGVPGAQRGAFRCTNKKWKPMYNQTSTCPGWDCDDEGRVCNNKGLYICAYLSPRLHTIRTDDRRGEVEAGSARRRWVPIASSCTGYVCSEEGQLCPRGVPGAGNDTWVCIRGEGKTRWLHGRDATGSNERWAAIACGD